MLQLSQTNHNCRHTNQNCHKEPQFLLLQPQLSQSRPTKNIAFLILILYKIMTFHTTFSNPCFTSSQLNYDNCEILWHTTRLSDNVAILYWNCDNCEIFKIIAVSYEKNSDIGDYSVFKYDWWWINSWSMELMTQGSSAVEKFLLTESWLEKSKKILTVAIIGV